MRPIAEAASRISGENFSRKFVALGRIVSQWEDIIGPSHAGKACPLRILYKKPPKHNPKAAPTQTVLEIAAASADATVLHYQVDLILERIEALFGERWIHAIRFVPVPSNRDERKGKKLKSPLTADEKNTLSLVLQGIEDDHLRLQLEMLGQHIIMDAKS